VASYRSYEVGYSIQGRRLLVFADSQARRGTIPLCFALTVFWFESRYRHIFFYLCTSHIHTNTKLVSAVTRKLLNYIIDKLSCCTCNVGIESGACICVKWEIMSQRYILSLIDSMLRRMNSVVEAQGFWTSYEADQFMKTAILRANILIPIWHK
jgi:hypothetical protein